VAESIDEGLFLLQEYANSDDISPRIKKSIKMLIEDRNKKSKRLERIIRQSDRQQRELMDLNDKLETTYNELYEYKAKLEKIHAYDVKQQKAAKQKILSNIVNDLENDSTFETKIIFEAKDILSGDLYSIFKREDGSIVLYLIDGQSHGILPSITVFAFASIFGEHAKKNISLYELSQKILFYSKHFLTEEEQLSYSIVEIDKDMKHLSYAIGGMYPMLVMDDNNIVELKANNLPMLNFSSNINLACIELKNFQRILIYTDGIVEMSDHSKETYTPSNIIKNPSIMDKVQNNIQSFDRDDDISLLLISKLI